MIISNTDILFNVILWIYYMYLFAYFHHTGPSKGHTVHTLTLFQVCKGANSLRCNTIITVQVPTELEVHVITNIHILCNLLLQ